VHFARLDSFLHSAWLVPLHHYTIPEYISIHYLLALYGMNHAELEKFCLSLKGTTTDVKWGNDLCYLIGDKMYCVTSLDQPMTVSMKVLAEEFSELTERDGIIPAPYMARNQWIFVEKAKALTLKEWKHYIQQSYKLVLVKLPRKIKMKIG